MKFTIATILAAGVQVTLFGSTTSTPHRHSASSSCFVHQQHQPVRKTSTSTSSPCSTSTSALSFQNPRHVLHQACLRFRGGDGSRTVGARESMRQRVPSSIELNASSSTGGEEDLPIVSIPEKPEVEFTFMWEVFNQQLFYSRIAYTYEYYLGNKRARGIGKTILEILEEAKPAVKAQYEEFNRMTEEEKKGLKGRVGAMYSNKEFMKTIIDLPARWDGGDQNFLVSLENDNQMNECLYGIWRDDSAKRIQIFFRGTETSRKTSDANRDLDCRLKYMPVPPLLKKIIEDNAEENKDSPLVDKNGNAIKTIPVHSGFYQYAFENGKAEKQAFDKIMETLDDIDSNPDYLNYEVWVSGHSLGASMATLIAFKLAGMPFKRIRKAVKCVTFSSPLTGCSEFRAAFQTLEKEGLLQHVRVANQEDFVPAGWPFSVSFPPKGYKHVGMNLELDESNFEFTYPTKTNGFKRTWQISFLRKLGVFFGRGALLDNAMGYILSHHGENLINSRMYNMSSKSDVVLASQITEPYSKSNVFQQLTIDDLYNDESLHDNFPYALKTKNN